MRRPFATFARSGSFRQKWIFSLLTASLLPLLITLVLVLNITSDSFEMQREKTLLAEAQRIQASLEKRLESIGLVNQNLSSYITARFSRGSLNREQNYNELLNYESMRDTVNTMEQIYDLSRIRIFTDRLPYVQRGNWVTLFTLEDLAPLSAEYPQILQPTGVSALRYLILENQQRPDKGIYSSNAARMISFYSNVYNTDRELIAVFMSEVLADDFLSAAPPESEGAVIRLLCGEGNVICRSGDDAPVKDLLLRAPVKGHVVKDGYLLYALTLDNIDWRLEIALPIGAPDIRNTLTATYLVILSLSFILALFLALVLSSQTLRRLGQYLDAVKSVDYTGQADAMPLPDQLDRLISECRSNDEIDQIMASFSTLIRDNLQLMASMKQRDLDIEKYKFQVLQEQINPHFLYNALDTMRLCIFMGQRDQALSTLDALSHFYRIALSKGRDTITVGEEMNMIRYYLKIENVGYAGRLKWDIQVENGCDALPIPKFLVQPLIENAIVHGDLSPERSHLSISISVKTQAETVVIRVANDGLSIDPETLERLNCALRGEDTPDGRVGFGLLNVNQRLKLFYGNECSLSIRSDQTGTENLIRIPAGVRL